MKDEPNYRFHRQLTASRGWRAPPPPSALDVLARCVIRQDGKLFRRTLKRGAVMQSVGFARSFVAEGCFGLFVALDFVALDIAKLVNQCFFAHPTSIAPSGDWSSSLH